MCLKPERCKLPGYVCTVQATSRRWRARLQGQNPTTGGGTAALLSPAGDVGCLLQASMLNLRRTFDLTQL